ncbi:hypothetical protein L7F22_031897 [Adiantum nelumboides]|nr:hypothetical protein [Adiantum nelumboides]
MSCRDPVPSAFRDFVRFGFPSSSWASSSAYPAGASDGTFFPQRDDGCSHTKVVKSRCFLDHSSDGKPIKKCEKTEQLLRNCLGKPQEIVETKSECTEEEVGDGWSMEAFNEEKGLKPFLHDSSPGSQSPWNPFQGTDPFSRGLSDGFEGFIQAAEEMMNEAFNQLGFYKEDEESIRHHSGRPQKMFPDTRSKGKNDSSSAEDDASKKVDFGDSRSFDEV